MEESVRVEESVRKEGQESFEKEKMGQSPLRQDALKEAGSLQAQIQAAFPGKRQDIRTYSPLTLAYIGDGIYDLIIRTVVVSRANRPANELHRMTVKYVSAGAQAKISDALWDYFTEDEQSIFRRGRNSKPHTTAKNATTQDYLKATGFEAVLGYLYLTDNMERALELVKAGLEKAGLKL